jgi:DNA polymerase-1
MNELRPCIPAELKPPINTILITTVDDLHVVQNFLETVPEFGLDIETNMVDDFFERRIRTIQVGNREQQYVIDLLAFAGSTSNLMEHMGGYNRGGVFKAPGLDSVRSMLQPFLETDKKIKVGHNLSFEYETLKWNLGLRIFGLYDTMLAEKVLNAGKVNFLMKGYWALDDLVGRYCGLKIDKTEQTTFDLCTPLTNNQIEYAGLDTRFPMAIKGAQMKSINELNLNRVIQIENDAIPAFSDMHLNGMLIDTTKWLGEIDKVTEIHNKNIQVLDDLFIPVVGLLCKPFSDEEERLCEKFWREETDPLKRPQYRKTFYKIRKENKKWAKDCLTFEGKANVQYGSPAQILVALQKAGVKLANTNDEILEALEGNPFIDAVREFRTTEKTLNSYGPAYLEKNIDKNTGRIHAIFDQLGAETGRTSSRKPNLQNIQTGSEWRSCFIARPGKVIITIDYSGSELRILAEVSGEKVWIDAFNAGWDVHSVGAEMIFGNKWKDAAEEGCAYYTPSGKFPQAHAKCKCKLHKVLREQIKSINFGVAYGMESGKLSRKVKITKEEALKLLSDYRKAFPAVTEWLKKAGNDAQATLRSITLAGRIRFYLKPDWEIAKRYAGEEACKKGVVLTNNLINRKYKSMYSSIERQGKNSPIQGLGSDMVKLAVGAQYMWPRLEPEFNALLISSVHDECVIEADESNAQEVLAFCSECMYNAGNEFLTRIKAEVEGHVSPCWSKD